MNGRFTCNILSQLSCAAYWMFIQLNLSQTSPLLPWRMTSFLNPRHISHCYLFSSPPHLSHHASAGKWASKRCVSEFLLLIYISWLAKRRQETAIRCDLHSRFIFTLRGEMFNKTLERRLRNIDDQQAETSFIVNRSFAFEKGKMFDLQIGIERSFQINPGSNSSAPAASKLGTFYHLVRFHELRDLEIINFLLCCLCFFLSFLGCCFRNTEQIINARLQPFLELESMPKMDIFVAKWY